jgi:hypothetical protein
MIDVLQKNGCVLLPFFRFQQAVRRICRQSYLRNPSTVDKLRSHQRKQVNGEFTNVLLMVKPVDCPRPHEQPQERVVVEQVHWPVRGLIHIAQKLKPRGPHLWVKAIDH